MNIMGRQWNRQEGSLCVCETLSSLFSNFEGEPEESREEADVKSDEEEAELVKPDLPASKDLTNEHNKLAEPEAIVVVEDVDDHDSDELEGLQVVAQVEKESKDSLD